MNVTEIVKLMKLYEEDETVQRVQTAHRMRIVEATPIKEGMRVLEIGCGQGDTTAVLAAKVGPTGFVKGIDIANGTYGAPITLAEATDHLLAGPLGQRMEFQLNTDLLDLSEDELYDVAIFSHCSWYMNSVKTLETLLQKALKIAKQVIVVEWDIVDVVEQQRAHQQAAFIQALYATQEETDANIHTLFTRSQVEQLLTKHGAQIESSTTVDATALQDGQWEIDYALQLSFSPPFQALASTMKETIKVKENEQHSMNSFLIIAKM